MKKKKLFNMPCCMVQHIPAESQYILCQSIRSKTALHSHQEEFPSQYHTSRKSKVLSPWNMLQCSKPGPTRLQLVSGKHSYLLDRRTAVTVGKYARARQKAN